VGSWCDRLGDFREVQVHRFGISEGQEIRAAPLAHLRVLVGCVVVDNGVDLLSSRHLRLDGVEEARSTGRSQASRHACAGVLRSGASAFRRRSAGLREMEIPVRMRQTRMHSAPGESPPGFKCQTRSTSLLISGMDNFTVAYICPIARGSLSSSTRRFKTCSPKSPLTLAKALNTTICTMLHSGPIEARKRFVWEVLFVEFQTRS